MRRQKNVAGIAAIQYPLRYIHSGSRYVRFVINIGDSIDWAAVNSHPQLDLRPAVAGSQHLANLERTSHWLFRTVEKQERHPVSGRHSNQFPSLFSRPKTFGASHDLIQFLQQLDLVIDHQFGITRHVD